MVEIAKCNGVGKQYVSRLIRLAFLAPEMGCGRPVNRLSLPPKHYGPAVLIFQWTGRRKREPSDLRSRLSTPYQQATALAHVQAKSTVQSANREKSPKLAFETRRDWFSGGPGAPDSGQMRVFHLADERIPET
jgi:hypothetical protein